ncbi:hypothetical protein [Streptomyces sp. CT34]|uniref:hypothetical protein n=1 Tax=Streptomyces sp. CT34 TaxID=1553907 RepID=UPI0005B98495|nr:hypothetical protein [Streptomyces sp. CT34]
MAEYRPTGRWYGLDILTADELALPLGGAGETVLRMEATGPTYDCRFAATLSVVSGPPDTCRPGSASTLEPMAGKLRRTFDDAGGLAPLLYTKTG